MHRLILTLFCFLPFLSFAQYPWPAEGESGKDYYLNSREKIDGLHYRTYDDGALYYVGEFENGKPKVGTTFYYYFNEGAPMSIHQIKSQSTIDATNYFPSGKRMSEGTYIDQKKNGEWTFYSEEGYVSGIESYASDLRNGEVKTFYPDGKEYKREQYVQGIAEGPWIEFYNNGKVRSKGTNVDGQFHGKVEFYRSDGGPLVQGEYTHGLKSGNWIKFNEKNKIEITTKYVGGEKTAEKRMNGSFTDYYDSGIPKANYEYEEGQLNGPFQEFYDVGEWVRKPREGQTSGPIEFVEKLEGTAVQREGDYLDGLLEGEIIYYDEQGKVVKIEEYSEGVIIEMD